MKESKLFIKVIPVIGFVLCSLILFFPSHKYGMVADFLNWMGKYRNGSFVDIVDCFDYNGLHQVFHFINYTFYKTAGLSYLAWYFLFALLHGINAYLVYLFIKQLLQKNESATKVSLIVSVLFLIFPYNVEVVVWKACLHYLLVTLFLLGGLLFLLNYLRSRKQNYWIGLQVCFVLSLFTLEVSFVFPFVFLSLIIVEYFNGASEKESLFKIVSSLIIPQFIFIAIYFLLSHFILGNFIGHYGAEKHLVFSPELILGNSWKYFFKNICFGHYLPHSVKEVLYDGILSNPTVYYGLSLLAILIFTYALLSWRKLNSYLKYAIICILCFFFLIAPIVNLYFMWLHHLENDRYGYVASPFLISAVIFFLQGINKKWIRKILISIYTLCSLLFFGKMIYYANQAGQINHQLLNNFEYSEFEGNIYVLSIPDNMKGFYLFKDKHGNSDKFVKGLDLLYHKKPKGTFIDVAQFNAVKVNDSVQVTPLDSISLKVQFMQYGNWFWKGTIGLSNYETDEYSVVKKGGAYIFKLKNSEIKRESIFIYPQDNIWKKIEW